MERETTLGLQRRQFLTRVVPTCALACLATRGVLAAAGDETAADASESIHPFDVKKEGSFSRRDRVRMQYGTLMAFIGTLREQMDDKQVMELLNHYSAENGRRVGSRQAQRVAVNDFENFVQGFRPPAYADALKHEVVEDTENAFEIRVTECVWADVFREAGLDGEMGHAAICNMDYTWPRAYNEKIKMVRDKTLMQGHSHCNHRYIDTA